MKRKHQRKLVNYLVEPFLQFRFALHVIAFLFIFSVVLSVFAYVSMKDFLDLILELTEIPEYAKDYAYDEIGKFLIGMGVIMIGFFVVATIFVIVETHKIVGAKYAIVKYFKSNLLQDKFDEPLFLRKKDYFKDIAELINEFVSRVKELRNH